MSAQPADPHVPPDHVTIEINGNQAFAPKGSMIIQAADNLGIAIPRFCYHEKLPIAANCRMCMVEVEMGGKPMPKPQPACATPVAEGLKIFTQSERALSAQRNVMEFLLINHPLDCPICDQGGECELQDLSVGYGRSISRFVERKRTIPDEDLGPLVATEMTRCIQCTRCVRVMSEVAGTYELGGMERGERLQIGTYVGKPLMSELSGNVIDVCPVGALTNKAFRFRARAWELIARPSIGYHDALGSNLWLHTRRGEVLRTVPRDNEALNECWLSDRDRYSHQGLYSTDRATRPLVKRGNAWIEVEWEEALRAASTALRSVDAGHLGALVHGATSSEEGYLLKQIVHGLGSRSIDHRVRALDLSDASQARAFEMPFADIDKAAVIVLVGCDPRRELPLLNARLRRASRRGAQIHAIGVLDIDLTYALAGKRMVAPGALLESVSLLGTALDDVTPAQGRDNAADAPSTGEYPRDLAGALATAESAVFIIGDTVSTHPQAAALRRAVRAIARRSGAACNELPLGANAVGLSRMHVLPHGDGLDAAAQLSRTGGVQVLYGIESALDLAGGAAAWKALAQLDQIVAFSAYASDALKQVAKVILPIGLLPEIEATLVNLDGTEQRVQGGAKLPGDARPGWRVLRALGAALAIDGFAFTSIEEVRATMPRNESVSAAETAVVVESDARASAAGLFTRIDTMAIYRGDAVLRRSPALNAHPLTRGARIGLNAVDASSLGIGHGGSARIGAQVLPVDILREVPVGAVWIESGYVETSELPPYGAALSVARA